MPKPEKEYIPPPLPTWRFYATAALISGIAGFSVGITQLSISLALVAFLIAALSGLAAASHRDDACLNFVVAIGACVFLYFIPLQPGSALTLYPLLIGFGAGQFWQALWRSK